MPRDADAIRDELLVLRCQRGEAAAFAELFRRWERRLLYYVRRLTPHEGDAWDVLHTTCMKGLHDLGRLRDPEALREKRFFTDYQDVNGVRRPGRWEIRHDGRRFAEWEATGQQVQATPFADGFFARP